MHFSVHRNYICNLLTCWNWIIFFVVFIWRSLRIKYICRLAFENKETYVYNNKIRTLEIGKISTLLISLAHFEWLHPLPTLFFFFLPKHTSRNISGFLRNVFCNLHTYKWICYCFYILRNSRNSRFSEETTHSSIPRIYCSGVNVKTKSSI